MGSAAPPVPRRGEKMEAEEYVDKLDQDEELLHLKNILNELRFNVPTCGYCDRNRYIINRALGRNSLQQFPWEGGHNEGGTQHT